MSHARAVVLFCACALITSSGVTPAPPRRADSTESEMAQEKSIVIKRIPSAYFYPFSLWPLPKFPVKDSDESYEEMYNMRRMKNVLVQKNKR